MKSERFLCYTSPSALCSQSCKLSAFVSHHDHRPPRLSLSLSLSFASRSHWRLPDWISRRHHHSCSLALFLLLLDRYVFCLVRLSAGFLRDFVPNRQRTRSASNIPSRIKLISRLSRIHSLSFRRRNILTLYQQFLPKNLQFLPSNLSGFSPRLSTIESSPATACHSFGSQLCQCVFAPQGPSGSSWFVRASHPGGISDCVGLGPIDCVA